MCVLAVHDTEHAAVLEHGPVDSRKPAVPADSLDVV